MQASTNKALRKWIAVPSVFLLGWGPLFALGILHWFRGEQYYSEAEAGFGTFWELSIAIPSLALALLLIITFVMIDLVRFLKSLRN